MKNSFFKTFFFLFSITLVTGLSFSQDKNAFKETYLKPDESIQDILTRDKHYDELFYDPHTKEVFFSGADVTKNIQAGYARILP